MGGASKLFYSQNVRKEKKKALPFDLFSYLKWSMKPLFMIWSTESTRKIVPNPLHLKEL